MKIFKMIGLTLACATLIAGNVCARDKPASAASSKEAAHADCAKEHGKMHDHAKEKGMGDGMMSKCMSEKAGAKKDA